MPFHRTLRFRLGVTLALVIGLSAAVFSFFNVAHTRNEILEQAIAQSRQTAEIIRRSTRYAMLQNHREQVTRIIEAVSRTRGFEKIRIFDREGRIIISTLPGEVGMRVDKSAEACFGCHAAGHPLSQLSGPDRHRIYESAAGHRVLGTIDVIRNETACSTADCHAHPAALTVLLMQGDFMRLNFNLPGEPAERRAGMLRVQRPHVVARRDERGVATLLRIDDGTPLAAGEMRIELSPKDGRWILVSDAWFFPEGEAKRWERAKYGEFRVGSEGRALLVGMRGSGLEPL